MLKKVFIVAMLLTLAACSRGGILPWGLHELELHVVDSQGQPLVGAEVRCSADKPILTDDQGRVSLRQLRGGLHVLTISNTEGLTRQLKVVLPREEKRLLVSFGETAITIPASASLD